MDNPFNFLNPPFKSAEDFKNFSEKIRATELSTVKKSFSGKIKQNFLIEILQAVEKRIGWDMLKYYPNSFRIDISARMLGKENPDYDICEFIVGRHTSNLIFLPENKKAEFQKSTEYKEKLINEVIDFIKVRQYGSVYFRKNYLFKNDNFLYFPVGYELFVLTVFLCNQKVEVSNNTINNLRTSILNKSFSILTMIEIYDFSSAYTLCRTMLEMYFKYVILSLNEDNTKDYNIFLNYEIELNSTGKLNEEFEQRFKNKYNNKINKIDYLHFGWLDNIDDYYNGYNIAGIIKYLRYKLKTDAFDILKPYYNRCHGYTHGNMPPCKYPLNDYFELSIMLFYVIRHIYCMDNDPETTLINGVNVLKKLDSDYKALLNQYDKRCAQLYEKYYKRI